MPTCPHCTYDVAPDNDFETSDGAHYHILCYQAACIENGLPDPFSVCDDCGNIIYQFNEAGELCVVIRGSKCDMKDGNSVWRAARWHPECAPGEAPNPDDEDDVAQPEPVSVALHEEGQPLVDEEIVYAAHAEPQKIPRKRKVVDPATLPVCPTCAKPIHRGATQFGENIYHRTCAAKQQVLVDPSFSRRRLHPRRPVCPVCKDAVPPDRRKTKEERKQDIECVNADGSTDHYHKRCYRHAMIEAGEPDPFPVLSGQEFKDKMAEAKVKAERKRKEATVLCGVCNQKVLRSAFVEHVIPCATKYREEAANA